MATFLGTLVQLSLAGTLLGLTVWAATRLLKRRLSKAGAYALWLLVLLRLLLPMSLPGEAPALLPEVPVVVSQEVQPLPSEPLSAPDPPALPDAGVDRPALLPQIWLAGALLFLGWQLFGYGRFLLWVRRTRLPPQPEDQAILTTLCPQHTPDLWCCPGLSSPMLAGLIRPVILLPEASYAGQEETLSHILRHELAHYHRWDILTKWLAVLARSLHWFNPLVHLLCRELDRACELACDERAVRGMSGPERKAYSYTLLSLAAEHDRAPRLTTALAQDKRDIKERLLSVLGHKPLTRRALFLTLALLLAAAAWALALGPNQGQQVQPKDPWVAQEQNGYLTTASAEELKALYARNEEFSLQVRLPLADGTVPHQPWTIGLGYYEEDWTAGSPYVQWAISRQPIVNENLAKAWLTGETWTYRGLLRVTTLTDLRTQAVRTGQSETPMVIGSLSTIQPGCTTHRGITIGDSLDALQSAYPELDLVYRDPQDKEALRAQGIVDHDACWTYAPEDHPQMIFFFTKADRLVQLDMAFQSSTQLHGLGYYLSDWAYSAGYLP